ncbi:MAG: HD domain-containing protein [Proteobacteria bacterium]|nr:HD domain-containing protein [Pseudomonadota bacterium]
MSVLKRGLPGLWLVAAILSGAALAADEPAGSAAGDAQGWRTVVSKFAQDHFHNPAWGYSHCQRDYALARELAAADHVALDDDVLYAAAYLHDMAAFEPWEKTGVDHADQAAELVGTILKNTGFPMKKLDAVRGAVRTHMYDRNPVGHEALYLHDADALDWLGAVGVARIFGLVDPKGGNPTGPEVVPMLESNLAKVPARVLSPAGKARVPERQEELSKFLRQLREQTQNLRVL